MTTRVSLAELAAAEIQLRPAEAAAIVSEICRRCASGELRGVPPPGVIRLSRDGEISVEGPMTTGDDVAGAAHLLNDLLAPFDAPAEYRASGALRLVIARALGTLDVPTYTSLPQFSAALSRFASADVRDAARGLVLAWERVTAAHHLEMCDPAELTISDIRRARRATGLSLQDVAAAANVPHRKLRDLEWGYPRDWRPDDEGRAQVIRYARAAGLDEGLVLSIAWPLIEETPAPPAREPGMALVPSGPQSLLAPEPVAAPAARGARRRWRAPAAAAILIAIALLGAMVALHRPPENRRASPTTAPVAVPADARAAADVPDAAMSVPLAAAATPPARPAVERASSTRPSAASSAAPAVQRPVRERPANARTPPAGGRAGEAPKRPPQRKPSFFQRELFRIVIR